MRKHSYVTCQSCRAGAFPDLTPEDTLFPTAYTASAGPELLFPLSLLMTLQPASASELRQTRTPCALRLQCFVGKHRWEA